MPDDFQYDVFLSHNAKDKARVRRLAERLREANLRVWFDEWVIKPGDDIYLAIERGLEASRVQVLCLTPAALGSDWVRLERSTVLFRDPSNAGRRFFPLLLADCKLPDTLRRIKHIDYRQETDSAFEEVLSMCKPPNVAAIPASSSLESLGAGLSNLLKHREPVFPTTERIEIAPLELCAKLKSIPPLQADDIKKQYLGYWVEWLTTLLTVSKHSFDHEFCSLLLAPILLKKVPVPNLFVNCDVRMADFPELKTLSSGAQVRVAGQIANFDFISVSLVNVRLSFPVNLGCSPTNHG